MLLKVLRSAGLGAASTAAAAAEELRCPDPGKGQDLQHLSGWAGETDDGDDAGVEVSF